MADPIGGMNCGYGFSGGRLRDPNIRRVVEFLIIANENLDIRYTSIEVRRNQGAAKHDIPAAKTPRDMNSSVTILALETLNFTTTTSLHRSLSLVWYAHKRIRIRKTIFSQSSYCLTNVPRRP